MGPGGVPGYLPLHESNVPSFGLEILMSFLALDLLMPFSIKAVFQGMGWVKMQCPKHPPWETIGAGKQGVKSRALLPAGDTGA